VWALKQINRGHETRVKTLRQPGVNHNLIGSYSVSFGSAGDISLSLVCHPVTVRFIVLVSMAPRRGILILLGLSLMPLASCSAPFLAIPDPLGSLSRSFKLQDEIIGFTFYDAFKFQTFDDPTHGRVKYVLPLFH
jgi:hypothetical protein